MDKSQQILDASIKVFTKKGFLGATTIEIANEANVAEVTLFRKFDTKQNLFEMAVKSVIDNKLSDVLEVSTVKSFDEYIKIILHNRLNMISRNIGLVRMLIKESLQGNLSSDLDFIKIISTKVNNSITLYIYQNNIDKNMNQLGSVILGYLLQYAIIEQTVNYHRLSSVKQEEFLSEVLSLLHI